MCLRVTRGRSLGGTGGTGGTGGAAGGQGAWSSQWSSQWSSRRVDTSSSKRCKGSVGASARRPVRTHVAGRLTPRVVDRKRRFLPMPPPLDSALVSRQDQLSTHPYPISMLAMRWQPGNPRSPVPVRSGIPLTALGSQVRERLRRIGNRHHADYSFRLPHAPPRTDPGRIPDGSRTDPDGATSASNQQPMKCRFGRLGKHT
jgi:hypothetical protein